MIVTENYEQNGRQLIRTYSDAGYMIANTQGIKYVEAIDPASAGRTYTETDESIPDTELEPQEALDIIMGVQK